jgi:RNA polymerase sigma factor (sigma-70 family)
MSSFDWSALTPLVVRAGKPRDADAFGEIYDLVWPLAYNFVLKHYGGTLAPEEAKDVIMPAFATIWRKLPMLREPTAFGSYFFKILARNCLAACRLKIAMAVCDSSDESALDGLVLLTPELASEMGMAADSGEPYQHLVQAELVTASRDRIMKVYENLTARQRLVFEARVLNLFDEKESAKRTGLPIGTIRGAYARIVELLRKEFGATEFRSVPDAERKVAFIEALAGCEQHCAGGLA